LPVCDSGLHATTLLLTVWRFCCYTEKLIQIGEADVDARLDELRAFLGYAESGETAAS
jgi:hypothetical protein